MSAILRSSGPSSVASSPPSTDFLLERFLDRLNITDAGDWPSLEGERRYTSRRTGKPYQPHNDEERQFVWEDVPRYALLKGGWGGGKSTAGAVKTLERLRRGMSGIAVSPDLPHFRKSLWPTLREWIPWDQVVPKHQDRQHKEWQPSGAFTMVFQNRTELHCGGIRDATAWYGGNVHFALFDEASRYPDDSAFKSLMGRVRLRGPDGEPPQLFLTTTPEMNWLAERFGPWDAPGDDPYADFKARAFVGTVKTEENLSNLDPEYADSLRAGLSPEEAELFLSAGWVRIASSTKFVNIIWWDNCMEQLPGMGRSEPMVLAADAAKGGETNVPDCFALVGVTRHPGRQTDLAVRYCGIWLPGPGQLLNFEPIEAEIRRICKEWSVAEIAYDPYQLHQMMTRLKREGVVNTREFPQTTARLRADKGLQDIIIARRIAHDGNPLLRQHIDNANIKKHSKDEIRLIKRAPSLKIDAAVALSMACERALYLNLAGW